MKSLKKATIGIFLMATFLMLAVGSYNSAITDKSSFLRNDFAIKLAKRLDEIKGEITIGRMAASVPTWKAKSTNLIKKEVNNLLKRMEPKKEKKKKVAKKQDSSAPAPIINESLDLALSGGFYNKKPLDGNSEFSGSAKVADGVIEEISVDLPGGSSFSINTNERMVGNVFQYEDTETREIKSGLFYKVKPGVFMVTLTNDSQYPGLRLEFSTNANVDIVQSEKSESNWGLNNQNEAQETNHVQNEEVQQDANEYQDAAREQQGDNGSSYGFDFNA